MSIDSLILGSIVVTSLILLAAKELAMMSENESAARLSKLLNLPLIIMLIIFILLLSFGIVEILLPSFL